MNANSLQRYGRMMVCAGLAVMFLAAAAQAAPKLEVDTNAIDLGKLEQGAQATGVFKLTNSGDEVLEIEKISTSCHCTAAGDHVKQIEPGQTVELPVKYNSAGHHGKRTNRITIKSNDPDRPVLQLSMTADVATLVEVKPRSHIAFSEAGLGQRIDEAIYLVPSESGADIEVQDVSMNSEAVQLIHEKAEYEGQKAIKLMVFVPEGSELGRISASASVRVKAGSKTTTVRVPIYGTIVGLYNVVPHVQYGVNPVLPGDELPQLVIRSGHEKAPKIRGVISGPHVHATLLPGRPGELHRVKVQIDEEAPAGPLGSWVRIYADEYTQPEVMVPVFTQVAGLIDVKPDAVFLHRGQDSTDTDYRLVTLKGKRSALKSLKATSSHEFITTRVVDAPADSGADSAVRIAIADNTPAGIYEAVVTATAKDGTSASIRVRASVE